MLPLEEVVARSRRQVDVVVFFILGDRLGDNGLGPAMIVFEEDSTCSANEKSFTRSPMPISEIAPSGDLDVGDRAATRVE